MATKTNTQPKGKRAAKTTALAIPAAPPVNLLAADDAATFGEGVEAMLADLEAVGKVAAARALQIGLALVWLRDTSPYGSLREFMAEHLASRSERTLFNYVRIADAFVEECNLRTAKGALSEAKVRPLLGDEGNASATAAKRAAKWIGDRGLSQIYRDLAAASEAPTPPKKKPGVNTGGAADAREVWRGDALTALDELVALRETEIGDGARKWQFLEPDELAELATALGALGDEVARFMRESDTTDAMKGKRKRGGSKVIEAEEVTE